MISIDNEVIQTKNNPDLNNLMFGVHKIMSELTFLHGLNPDIVGLSVITNLNENGTQDVVVKGIFKDGS